MQPIFPKAEGTIPENASHVAERKTPRLQLETVTRDLDDMTFTPRNAPLLSEAHLLASLNSPVGKLPSDLSKKIVDHVNLATWAQHTDAIADPVNRADAFLSSPRVNDRSARFESMLDLARSAPGPLAQALCVRRALEKMPADGYSANLERLIDFTELSLHGHQAASHAIGALALKIRTPAQFERLLGLTLSIEHTLNRTQALSALASVASKEQLSVVSEQLQHIQSKPNRDQLSDAIFIRNRELQTLGHA